MSQMSELAELDLPPGFGGPAAPVVAEVSPMDQKARNLVMASIMMISVAVVGVGAYSYDRYDTGMRIMAYAKRLQSEQEATKMMTDKEISSLKSGTAAYAALLKRLKTNLPDTNEVPSLLDSLQRIASGHNVAVVQITPQPKMVDSLFTAHPVTVVLSGKFLDVTETISELSRMPRLMIPVRVNVRQVKSGTPRVGKFDMLKGIVDADMVFHTYTLPTGSEKAEFNAKLQKTKGGKKPKDTP